MANYGAITINKYFLIENGITTVELVEAMETKTLRDFKNWAGISPYSEVIFEIEEVDDDLDEEIIALREEVNYSELMGAGDIINVKEFFAPDAGFMVVETPTPKTWLKYIRDNGIKEPVEPTFLPVEGMELTELLEGYGISVPSES